MKTGFPSGLHLHTHYGDGNHSPEAMIRAAIDAGFLSVGLSEHAYAPYDTDCCIPQHKMSVYRDEILALKELYAGVIEVYLGIEVDAFSLHDKSGWDYVIGSVHYVKGRSGALHTVDHNAEKLLAAAEDLGGMEALVREYAESVASLAETFRPDILGHIDVITKLNEGNRFFDEESSWYLAMWEGLIERIAATGCIVELNSGAVSRGYRKHPYPAPALLAMLKRRGVPVTISSDAHDASALDACYPEMIASLRDAGYASAKMMMGGRFLDHRL